MTSGVHFLNFLEEVLVEGGGFPRDQPVKEIACQDYFARQLVIQSGHMTQLVYVQDINSHLKARVSHHRSSNCISLHTPHPLVNAHCY